MLYKKINIFVIILFFGKIQLYSQNNYLLKAKQCYVIDSNIYYGEKHLQQCLNNLNGFDEIIEAYSYLVSKNLNKEKFTKANNLVHEMFALASKLKNKEMEYVAIGLLGDVEKYNKNYSKKEIILLNNVVIPLSRNSVDDFEIKFRMI